MDICEFHKRLAKDGFPLYVKMPILTFSSWLFQGVLYMDTTERIFKILLDILFFIPLYLVFRVYFYSSSSTLMAVMLSHTLNWIFNGQIFVLLGNLRLIKIEPERFSEYLDNLRKRISKEKSVLAAAAFGSLSRGELTETSDLDIRIIRNKGFINGLRACFFVLIERSRTFFSKFPLDIYVLDNVNMIPRHIRNEEPIVIYDPYKIFRRNDIKTVVKEKFS